MNEEYHLLFMNCVHALFKFCCNNLSWINKMCIFLTKMLIKKSTKKQLFKETSTFCITTYDKTHVQYVPKTMSNYRRLSHNIDKQRCRNIWKPSINAS